MENNNPTLQNIKDIFDMLSKNGNEGTVGNKKYIVYSEAEYDYLFKKYGEGCGWDKDKVVVIRGYPKFE